MVSGQSVVKETQRKRHACISGKLHSIIFHSLITRAKRVHSRMFRSPLDRGKKQDKQIYRLGVNLSTEIKGDKTRSETRGKQEFYATLF